MTAASVTGALRNVSSDPDTAQAAPRARWLSHVELIALIERDYDARGVRLYPQKVNHLVDFYSLFVKFAAVSRRPSGHASWSQLGRQLYDDVSDYESVQAKNSSLRRWARELERLGVLHVRFHKNRRGQFDGIYWRLLESNGTLPSEAASARSSAGSSDAPCQWRKRRETPQERSQRRVRPWCRRSGRKGVGRFEKSADPLFSSQRFGTSLPSSLRSEGKGDLRARGTASRLTRASGRAPTDVAAALDALRTAASGAGGLERLRSAALAGADPVDVALVGWELVFAPEPAKLSEKRAHQFAAAAAQLDRLRRSPGSTAVQLLDMLAGTRELASVGAAEWPGSLAYFTTAIRQQARAERRRARGLSPVEHTGQGQHREARYRSRPPESDAAAVRALIRQSLKDAGTI